MFLARYCCHKCNFFQIDPCCRTFLGEEDLLRSKGVEVIVLNDAECIDMMTKFINEKPQLWNEDIGV